jgi:hypothetical protein
LHSVLTHSCREKLFLVQIPTAVLVVHFSVQMVGHFWMQINTQDLHSVIVGTSISTANIETIRELLARREHPVQLLQARPDSNKYALILEEI